MAKAVPAVRVSAEKEVLFKGERVGKIGGNRSGAAYGTHSDIHVKLVFGGKVYKSGTFAYYQDCRQWVLDILSGSELETVVTNYCEVLDEAAATAFKFLHKFA